ncbi:hypothetical protein DPMN_006614 [Dreissena polymorpha]|uniref:Uncharacterized protein n=1 Tax=Dreissena polymorpha TaxID=45954 RepID=A0A9D4MUX4_DREPO|nr:hypothetical protein DPMN_006614 [Dreissena polymorpha]
MDLSAYMVRLSLDVVSTLNCLLDPFLYVLWFKECKLELLKIFSCLGQVIKDKAASLHYEVFDIVPYERTSVIRSMPRKFEEKREVDMNNTIYNLTKWFNPWQISNHAVLVVGYSKEQDPADPLMRKRVELKRNREAEYMYFQGQAQNVQENRAGLTPYEMTRVPEKRDKHLRSGQSLRV